MTGFPEGGVGTFGFADLANFWFGFSVFTLENCGFSVLVSWAVCGFSPIQSSNGFWFLSKMIAVFFGFFCPMLSVRLFWVLPRKSYPAVALKL